MTEQQKTKATTKSVVFVAAAGFKSASRTAERSPLAEERRSSYRRLVTYFRPKLYAYYFLVPAMESFWRENNKDRVPTPVLNIR